MSVDACVSYFKCQLIHDMLKRQYFQRNEYTHCCEQFIASQTDFFFQIEQSRTYIEIIPLTFTCSWKYLHALLVHSELSHENKRPQSCIPKIFFLHNVI